MVTEEIQKLCEMEEVGGEVGAGNKNVIKIDKSEGEVAEDVIHESLKCLGSILEAKGHGEEFIEAKGSDDGSFWDIRGSNRNLISTVGDISLERDKSLECLCLHTAFLDL